MNNRKERRKQERLIASSNLDKVYDALQKEIERERSHLSFMQKVNHIFNELPTEKAMRHFKETTGYK